jgi:hypothetical protein
MNMGLFGKSDDGPSAESVAQANQAQAAAMAESNRIAAEQAQHQQELNNINQNFASNLTADNRPVVQSGGSAADAAATVDNPDQKRRRPTAGLSSTLGINV